MVPLMITHLLAYLITLIFMINTINAENFKLFGSVNVGYLVYLFLQEEYYLEILFEEIRARAHDTSRETVADMP